MSQPSQAEVERLLTLASELKDKQRRGIQHDLLKGKTLGLLFQKPSTRTRVSFEAGCINWAAMRLSCRWPTSNCPGESVADTARVLSRYLDGIVIRTYDHATVEEWARKPPCP